MKSTKDSFIAILALLILASMSLPGLAQKKQDAPPIPKPGELVWPAPPEEPRIGYQSMIAERDSFRGKEKKKTWLDRLMGEKSEKDKMLLARPYGIAVDEDGRIYVADARQQAIVLLNQHDRSFTTWKGNAQIGLMLPVGLALDNDSRLFVSDSRGAHVVVFSPEGVPIESIGSGLMERPAGLAIDSRRGRIYVGDVSLHKILVYDLKTLKFIKQFGGEVGSGDPGPDVISTPANLAVDREGNLLVSDTLQCRIIVFNSEGKFIRSFGERGDSLGEFARPKGIALDSDGHIYVVDAAFGNIQIFNAEGQLMLVFSSGGQAPGYLSLPTGIAIDSQDRIYVAEHSSMGSGRLQIFQYLSETQQSLVADRVQEIR